MISRAASIDRAARCIHQGGVIAYPAEACFGLGCHPEDTEALARIRQIKQRSPDQGFILVTDKLERLSSYMNWAALAENVREQLIASWPGPVSWLVPASSSTGAELRGKYKTLAVRVTAFATLRELCSVAAVPLVSTSANRRREVPCVTGSEVEQVFAGEIDYILDLPIQGLATPSKIIDAATQQIIRPV